MMIRNKFLKVVAGILMIGCLSGCGTTTTEEVKDSEVSTEEVTEEAEVEVTEGMRIFVDSAGRTVEVPEEINDVVPTGPISQIYLYTACPDLMVGLATEFSEETELYLERKYLSLPVIGQLYGSSESMNLEELLNCNPDVIIDIGELKDSTVEDLDLLQEQVGIPVVFIEMSMYSMDEGYTKLGELLSTQEATSEEELSTQDRLAEMGAYASEIITNAESITATYEGEKKSVYLALGTEGLNTNAEGSYHAEILELLGIDNVADVEVTGAGAGSEVSMEQVILWNPEIILTYTEDVYEIITTDSKWADIDAVKNDQVYKVPTEPYNFISDPPAVNRIIGVQWLGNLVYPELYEFEKEDMNEFYSTFYHIDLEENDAVRVKILRKSW